MQQGLQQGKEKGEFIGGVLLSQRLLKLTLHKENDLEAKSLDELRAFAQKLDARLTL